MHIIRKKETDKQLKILELYVDSQDESRITCKIIKLSLQIHLFTTKWVWSFPISWACETQQYTLA
jgi:hypothetical protein